MNIFLTLYEPIYTIMIHDLALDTIIRSNIINLPDIICDSIWRTWKSIIYVDIFLWLYEPICTINVP